MVHGFVLFGILSLFLSPMSARADNSVGASVYLGALSYCPKIQEEELARYDTKCGPSKLKSSSDRVMFSVTGYRIYEESVFHKADQNQMIKNNCMIQQIKYMLDPSKPGAKENFEAFRSEAPR